MWLAGSISHRYPEVQAPDWSITSCETLARMVDLDLDDLESVVGRQPLPACAASGQQGNTQRIGKLLQNLHEVAEDILKGDPDEAGANLGECRLTQHVRH